MIPIKTFLYFLLDTPTGKAYYRSASGTILSTVITAGLTDVSLKKSPGNWLDTTLSFDRNKTYHGINISYANSQEFVLEVKSMIEELTLQGVGIETPLMLAVFKHNTTPQPGEPIYKLYYKALLDLPNTSVTALETLSVNLMEGGVTQLLKAYENTIVEIPCDGSLPEHIKANCDGMLVEDRLYYNIAPVKNINNNTGRINVLPIIFINNESDNYGVVHGNETFEDIPNFTVFSDSTNSPLYFNAATDVYVKGQIVVQKNGFGASQFNLWYTTNILTTSPVSIIGVSSPYLELDFNNKPVVLDINFKVTLAAYEKLFFPFTFFAGSSPGAATGEILSGNLQFKFVTRNKDSRPWGLTAVDLWKLIGQKICSIASTTNQTFNYTFDSDLLDQYKNLFCTCGDALRASNDPTYQRFFNINENNDNSFGPVIKISLKQFYEALRLPTFGGISKGTNGSSLIFTSLDNLYNSSVVNYSIGEVSKFKYKLQSPDYVFSDAKIGWQPKDNDQKSGKFDWNTTAKYKAPVITVNKELNLTSNMVWSAQVIERLRANNQTGAQTSSTRNTNDNTFAGLVIDRDNWIMDYFRSQFISLIATGSGNTNIHLANDQSFQPFDMPITDGGYFAVKKDFGIFVFSEDGYSATESVTIDIDATINSVNRPASAPVDTINIVFWHNGTAVKTYNYPVTGINTHVVINDTFSEAFLRSDCIYITADTSTYCEATINTISLQIGSYVTMSGANIPVGSGLFKQVLSMPTVTPTSNPYTEGTSKVQTGFQYFQYNSLAFANNFNIQLGLLGYRDGSTNDFEFKIYLNGQQTPNSILITGSVPIQQFAISSTPYNTNLQLGDIIFVEGSKGSPSGGLNVQLVTSTLSVESTYTKAYKLYRVNYDNLTGFPILTQDGRTDGPGAPFNIEYVSPGRLRNLWEKYFNSHFLDQVTGPLTFTSLDKNPYLATTKGTLTVIENEDLTLLQNGRLFYPIEVEMDFYCPLTFDEQQSLLINSHLHFTLFGKDFYFHVTHISQKLALNETTTARGLLSPLSNPAELAKISSFKIPDMGPNSIFCPTLAPTQSVPLNQTQPDKYKTFNRDKFLFKDQISRWFEQTGYCQPVQIGDPVKLIFISRDLDPVTVTFYKCEDQSVFIGPINLDTIPCNALASPTYNFILWQKYIDTSTWPEGDYYYIISATTGDLRISECLDVREDWPDTLLFEYSNSFNTQQTPFLSNVPFEGSMRVKGLFDNRFKQKYLGKYYVDQPQNVTILNGIPFETTTLHIGGDGGVPDYVHKKVLRILTLDNVKIDGEEFSIEPGAEYEDEIVVKGAPKTFKKIEIRPKNNLFGDVTNSTGVDADKALMITVDAGAFGPNQTNSSGSTEPVLIDLLITP